MWLINTSTIELERANPDDMSTTPYAILSHTWGEEEVTFQDMIRQDRDQAIQKSGYIKILKTCELAREKRISYAWVDTCCIDKCSSAELAEGINSMFRWYKQASICFAHLGDLRYDANLSNELKDCRWFTRGWTLQELIAPRKLSFYNSAWEYIGTRGNLWCLISEITGISDDYEIPNDTASLEVIPVARRMSWAANRKTTRVEDIAYCLLGIFDVNMPMLYGEGAKAFERLQEEIIKQTTDMSLFAWKAKGMSQEYRGILAQSPAEFAHCRRLSLTPRMRTGFETAMTNKGLKLETCLGTGNILNLACRLPDGFVNQRDVGVYLTKTADGYVRSRPTELYEAEKSHLWVGARYNVFIRKRVTPFVSEKLETDLARNIAVDTTINPGYKMHSFAAKPADLWDRDSHCFITNNYSSFTGFLDFQISDTSGSFVSNRIVVVCGLTPMWRKDVPRPLVSWASVYYASDSDDSGAIMDCVNKYYGSYGDELYLEELRSRLGAREDEFPSKISVLSNDGLHDLIVSVDVQRSSRDGAGRIQVTVKKQRYDKITINVGG